jgi:hypothetical protein
LAFFQFTILLGERGLFLAYLFGNLSLSLTGFIIVLLFLGTNVKERERGIKAVSLASRDKVIDVKVVRIISTSGSV